MTATHGSLFTGIGGFDLGLERAGWACQWQVEIDGKANGVLAHHWPDVERVEDICDVGRNNLKPVDLISGGFPCQDLSVAGKRKGLAGKRSGLWYEFHRVLAELKPQWVIIENVSGLLSSNGGRDFATILQGLAEIGYLSAWRILDAQYFGVAQRRRRVFIVGSLGDGRAAEVLFERKGSEGDTPPRREAGEEVAAPIKASTPSRRGGGSWPIAEEFVLPFDTTSITSPSNRSNPQSGDPCHTPSASSHAPCIVRRALSGNNQRNDPDGEHFVVVDPAYALGVNSDIAAYNWQSGGDVRLGFGLPNLQAHQVPAVEVRRLTPTEYERLQGFPPALTWEVSKMTRDEFAVALLASGAVVVNPEQGQVFVTRGPGGYKLQELRMIQGSNCNGYRVSSFRLGKSRKQLRLHRLIWTAVYGIIPEGKVIHHINHNKTDNRIANLESLTATDNSARAAEEGQYLTGLNNPATKIAPEVARQIADDYRHAGETMRQLAERYGISKSRIHQIVHEQGWTSGCSDTARYKMLGNAVCVPVAEWLGRRLYQVHTGR